MEFTCVAAPLIHPRIVVQLDLLYSFEDESMAVPHNFLSPQSSGIKDKIHAIYARADVLLGHLRELKWSFHVYLHM